MDEGSFTTHTSLELFSLAISADVFEFAGSLYAYGASLFTSPLVSFNLALLSSIPL